MYRLKKYNRFASQVLTRTDQRKMKEAKAKEKQDKKDNQKDQEPQKGKRTKTSEAEGPGADVEEKPPAKRRRGKQPESAGDGDAKHDPTSQPEPKGKARAKAKAKAKAKAAASKEEGGGETAEAEEAEETKAKAEVVPKRKPRAKAKAKVEGKVEEISKEEEPKAKPKRLRRADTKPYHHSPTKDAPQPEEGMVTPRKTLFQSDDSDDGEQEFKGPALPAEPPSPHMRIADTKTGEVKPLTQIFEEDKPKRHAKSNVEKKSGAASSSFEAADASVGGDAVSSKPKGKGRAGKAKATPKRKNAKNTLSPFAKKEHQKRQRKQKEVMHTSPTEDKVVQDMMVHHAKKCKDMSFEDMKIYLRGTEHKWKHFRLNPYFGRQACGVKTNLVKGDGKSTTEVSYYGKIGTAKNANQGMAVCFTSACLMVSWLMCVCVSPGWSWKIKIIEPLFTHWKGIYLIPWGAKEIKSIYLNALITQSDAPDFVYIICAQLYNLCAVFPSVWFRILCLLHWGFLARWPSWKRTYWCSHQLAGANWLDQNQGNLFQVQWQCCCFETLRSESTDPGVWLVFLFGWCILILWMDNGNLSQELFHCQFQTKL